MAKILLAFCLLFFYGAKAQNFTTGNLVVYRVGTGTTALSSSSTAIFLDEYTPAGALVQSLPMPVALSGAQYPLTASGSATSEGLLNRSADGRYLVATGYGAAPGTASVASSGASVPRVVGLVDYQKTINTSTALSDFAAGNNPRSAISSDGTAIWVAGGAGGIRYTTNGSTTSTQLSTASANNREVNIFGGQLYLSSGSGSIRIATVGTGLPTSSGQAVANLPGFPTSGSPFQFLLFDLDAGVSGYDVLYVADDGAGIQKYSLVSGSWVLNGTVGTSSDAYRGLTGSASGTTVTLFATRKNSELVALTDAAGYNVPVSGTPSLLATAATNTVFRGLAFTPVAPVNNLSLSFTAPAAAAPLAPPAVTATLADPTDPLSLSGISVDIKENGSAVAAADYTLTATSSNTGVVPDANIVITKADGQARVKATAAAAGYASITITLTKGGFTRTLVLDVAASAASNTPAASRFHSGSSDASAAIAIDSDYMIIADDEMNKLAVFNRNASGLAVATYNYGGLLGLTDLSGGVPREVDVEAAVKSIANTGRIYWLGSMSNSATSFNARPNRNRLFAVTYSGTGAATTFSYVGLYGGLKQDLLTWGDANGYGFSASAAAGKDPKQIDGFNIEGLVFAPDNTTAYIGFRAPLVPTAARTRAVIAPVQNFEAWFNNGAPAGSPVIGAPIELNLGGRGIRDLVRLSNGSYIILAGNYDDTPLNPAIFTWTGLPGAAPVQINSFNLSGLNPEGVMEVQASGSLQADRLQIVNDNGDFVYYGDGVAAKDLGQNNYKKFRSDVLISGTGSVLPVLFTRFNVSRQTDGNRLSWDMALPVSCTGFIVERSADGRSFWPLGSLSAFGATAAYGFTDIGSTTAKLYYRIAAVDADGRKTYSAIRYLGGDAGIGLALYPNPAADGHVSLTAAGGGIKYAAFFDVNGRRVKSLSFTGDVVDVSLDGLPAGTYEVVVSTAEKIVGTKTLVIR